MIILVSLGALNLLWVRQLLEKGLAGVSWLNRLVKAEAVVAVVLLLAVGFMTNLQPPHQTISQPIAAQPNPPHLDYTVDGVQVSMEVLPDQYGPNTVTVSLTDISSGAPIANASLVSLTFKSLAMDMGENTVYTKPTEPGKYLAQDVYFNMTGAWQGQLLVTRPDAFDLRLTFQFTITDN